MVPALKVRIGGITILHITTFQEASQFLEEWDTGARNAFYYLAADALAGFDEGIVPPEVARLAFETFCREVGILSVQP
ncbi:DUF982 domain-containing protein [Aminobacter sp. UC22_36]|uniref:DUF982 domain-containing protein n=1 Tax=Aminobacter sp. UC22_36 TaxID=3374549 RepID=UPI003757344B